MKPLPWLFFTLLIPVVATLAEPSTVLAGDNSTEGTLSVRVLRMPALSTCDAGPGPVVNAIVTATNRNGGGKEVVATDASGEASMRLEHGRYDVRIEKVGHKAVLIEDIKVRVALETDLGEVTLVSTSVGFNKDRAILLAIMANIAYGDGRGWGNLEDLNKGDRLIRPDAEDYPEMSTSLSDYLDPCWKFYRYMLVESSSTDLFIANNLHTGDLVVAFRGTSDIDDALTDANIVKVDWTFRDGTVAERAVHKGFRDAYLLVKPILQEALDEAIGEIPARTAGSRVYFTGHSLGGALATLAALDLSDYLVDTHGYDRNNVIMYSFAAPRSITERLTAPQDDDYSYESLVPHGHAVAAKDDFVTHVPGLDTGGGNAEYTHIDNLVVLSSHIFNTADNGSGRYERLGNTRIEYSRGRPYEGCNIVGGPTVGPPWATYGKKGHEQMQYIKRLENIVDDGIPDLSVVAVRYGWLGERLQLRWEGGVQGPCDWVALYQTDKGGAAPNDADSYIRLVNGWRWVVKGSGFPDNQSRHTTKKNPNGPIDANKDFWIGYVDGFGRIIATKKWNRPRELAAPSGIDFAAAPTQTMALLAPSPNPASGATALRFSLPEEAEIHLEVFDVTGRLVRRLAHGSRAPGNHVESWNLNDQDGRAVGGGVYFARLIVGERSLVQKVMVTR